MDFMEDNRFCRCRVVDKLFLKIENRFFDFKSFVRWMIVVRFKLHALDRLVKERKSVTVQKRIFEIFSSMLL